MRHLDTIWAFILNIGPEMVFHPAVCNLRIELLSQIIFPSLIHFWPLIKLKPGAPRVPSIMNNYWYLVFLNVNSYFIHVIANI